MAPVRGLLGDATYLYTQHYKVNAGPFRNALLRGILTSLVGGQPLPTPSNVLSEGVVNSTLSSSAESDRSDISTHVAEEDVLHS